MSSYNKANGPLQADELFYDASNPDDVDVTAPGYMSAAAARNPDRAFQWYLDGPPARGSNGTGANVVAISNEYTGAGIIVGIVDEGFDLAHPDLANRFDARLSYDPRDAGVSDIRPDTAAATHGTWVAGVIGAAADNGFGIVGVAPGATLAGFYARFGFGGSSRAELADLLARQSGVDVSNNSWGYVSAFSDNFRDPYWSAVEDALRTGATDGREGLGTVYVFAAGNDRQYIANTLACDGDNTNDHSLTNSRFTITAAASTASGHITSFSTPGASVFVTAPGESIMTTAVTDGDGVAANDFAFVSGTSFAAPIVSGVVAMMLEANPHLGYRDVQDILALSSHKIDAGAASWAMNGAANWNGGGNLVSHDFGFGLIDAHAAVRLAESWTSVHAAANEATISLEGNVGTNGALVDFQPRSFAASVPADYANFSLQWVEVDVTLAHSHIGDLRIHLVSPSGTDSLLMDKPGAGTNARSNLSFTFSTNHDWGESPVGTWTLVVEDAGTGGTGSLSSYALRFYGDDHGVDDTYYFTDDFATLAGDRGTIRDASGNDTYVVDNAADTVVETPNGGYDTVVSSVSVALADNVEKLVLTGAGDLHGTGNDLDNVLVSNAGADTLAGGGGNDVYYVHNALDHVVEAAGGGVDDVYADVTFALPDNVETLVLVAPGEHASTAVTTLVDSVAGAAATTAFAVAVPNIDGAGNDLDNTLVGTAGANVLNGGHGADTMIGGAGNDVYVVDNSGDVIVEAPGEGADVVFACVSCTLSPNVENLIAWGGDALTVTGNDLGNTMFANAAGGTFDGGGGADGLIGGPGNDTLAGGDGADWIYAGAGNDTLLGGADTDVLSGDAGDDRLLGDAGDDYLFGGDGADRLEGGPGSDALFGQAGDDVLDGGEADDGLLGGAGNDTLVGGEGNDWLYGEEGDDLLLGGNGVDVLVGGDGSDRLEGGAGGDFLVGGEGADTFVFTSPGAPDCVWDFVSGADVIELSRAGFGLPDGVVPLIAEGDGLPADFFSEVPVIYVDSAGAALWFDATGGASDDAVVVAGFVTGCPAASDLHFM
jgi:Ca2+-binding RTX toxin-like protein